MKGTQYLLLSFVVKLGLIRAVDLAGAMRVSTSTLSRNLQPLVGMGLLAILPGADARSRLIIATEDGKSKRTRAQRKWRIAQEAFNDSLELLSPAGREDDDA